MSAMLLLVVTLLVPTVLTSETGPTYATTLFEGTKGPTLVTDCTYDKRGTTGMVTAGPIKFAPQYGDFPSGTKLTGYDVANLKTSDQGTLAKTSGGLGQSYLWFDFKSVNGHGLKFQFKLWGTVPAGAKFKVNTGNC